MAGVHTDSSGLDPELKHCRQYRGLKVRGERGLMLVIDSEEISKVLRSQSAHIMVSTATNPGPEYNHKDRDNDQGTFFIHFVSAVCQKVSQI